MITHTFALLATAPTPPPALKKSGAAYWTAVVTDYELSASDLNTLQMACVQLDRAASAARDIRRRGQLVKGRFDLLVENPSVGIERAAMNAHRLLVRELALTAEPPDNRPLTSPRGYK